jgi:hypothetical protein
MATTTNYGWTTPDDTSLVKDGASAIRSLGSAIDTTVFNNAGAAIAKTIVDAKGDIIAATAADTVSRLAVGANDTVLTADSSTATGLKWAAAGGGAWTQSATGSMTGTSITISSLSAKRYFIVLDGVSHNAGSNQEIRIQVNGDTGNNYYMPYETSSDAQIYANVGVGAASSVYQTVLIDLADTAAQYKPFYCQYRTGLVGGNWKSTAAITSIRLFLGSGSFDAGTYYVWSFA